MTKASRQSLGKPFMALFSDSWHVDWISRTHLQEDPFFFGFHVSANRSLRHVDGSPAIQRVRR